MKPWLKWTLLALLGALLLAGGLRTLTARKTQQAALQAQQAALKTQVSINLQPQDLIKVKERTLPLTVALAGPLQAVRTAVLKARVSGELQGLTVREGDAVKAGQVLGHIDPTEAQARLRQARQQAQAAKAQVDIAQRNYDNNAALVTQGFISSTALVSSQASLAAAQATFAAAQAGADVAAKSMDDTLLRAPISGQVSQRLAQPGERVGVDARVLEIVDLSQLELAAALSAADALRVQIGQAATLQVEGSAQTVAARVVRVNPSTAAGSRAVMVYLSVQPQATLRHGQYAQGALTVGSLQTTVVPLTTIRTDQPQAYVQVVQDNKVEHVQVQPGARSEVAGQTLVAISGVSAGSTVIAGAVGVLREGTQVVLTAQK
ncbi:MAG: efflux RND transporter periplasmic adaptor subunit [Rhodoferax sp.]|nr:efflux RND transporter periplasmic adaptor subunit [Rhodoferax sp.]NCP54214.1 efflux RND transporter periplasmic adaptor subunit [Rhodoferax sp.]PIW09149.1 MAG: efflux transporter periplasmic adaptor subunit [Comamonadaceae bacterium CG17_big_fil_post_rev_8_21_14_2_50_60_13]PIY25173.1 MAG: efflux transporter periplasmic adaptor subunit [Comamonadaceae bacterium CG_4_10_14_3_um_filter_60_75]PJC11427.1 MAG: efflux transporter periplasmic adaptor subunit [Comamonadaceae bacterium CG_4_9_14_0_8_